MTVIVLAQFIGAYAIQILIALIVVVLLGLALAWRLFEMYQAKLWAWGSKLWRFFIDGNPHVSKGNKFVKECLKIKHF